MGVCMLIYAIEKGAIAVGKQLKKMMMKINDVEGLQSSKYFMEIHVSIKKDFQPGIETYLAFSRFQSVNLPKTLLVKFF